MNENELVTVIMSEYNTNEQLLDQSIKSILNQTYKNIEFIIIDDSGNMDLRKRIKKYKDQRIKVYTNKKNMGLVYSLNKAVKLAKGQYIARMDTDDISKPNRIEKQIAFMKAHKEISVLASRCNYYDEDGIWGESTFYGEMTKQIMLNGNKITHPTVMYKKETIQNAGGYLDYSRCEDTATWTNLISKNYRFYVMKDVLLDYHLSKNDYKKRSIRNRFDSFRNIREQYIKLSPSKKQIMKAYIKLIISSVIPQAIIYKYHRKKLGRKNEK